MHFLAVDPLLRIVLKNGNSLWYRRDYRLVVLEVRIFGLGGPYHWCQIALLPSIMPPFLDSSLLRLMLPATLYLIKPSGRVFNLVFPSVAFMPFFGNLLLMFLLYFKNMDGVALWLSCLLVSMWFMPHDTGPPYPLPVFFFWFVRGTYVRSTSPFYVFFYSIAFSLCLLLISFPFFFSSFSFIVYPWPRREHQENY